MLRPCSSDILAIRILRISILFAWSVSREYYDLSMFMSMLHLIWAAHISSGIIKYCPQQEKACCAACWFYVFFYVLCQKWRIKHVQSSSSSCIWLWIMCCMQYLCTHIQVSKTWSSSLRRIIHITENSISLTQHFRWNSPVTLHAMLALHQMWKRYEYMYIYIYIYWIMMNWN